VAESDDREEAVAAATAIYVALIPTILDRGKGVLKLDLADGKEAGDDDEGYRALRASMQHGNALAAELRAREWGVGVYDGRPHANVVDAERVQLVYWIGATREDVSL